LAKLNPLHVGTAGRLLGSFCFSSGRFAKSALGSLGSLGSEELHFCKNPTLAQPALKQLILRNEPCPVCKYGHLSVAHWLVSSTHPSTILASAILMQFTHSSLTCRQRKLKCDEQKPICSQCRKAHKECRASEAVVFRHQQNASMNAPGATSEGNLLSFYGYRNTFNPNHIWVKIPNQSWSQGKLVLVDKI
jgi:hypothetical protein